MDLDVYVEQINEEDQEKFEEIKELEVKYDAPAEYYVEAPIKFSESDISIYLDDCFLNKLPGSFELAKKFFGEANANKISDAYFEYDRMEQAVGENPQVNLKWDSHYAPETVSPDDELAIFVIKNLKYIIRFDGFDLVNVSYSNYKSKIDEIFKYTVSNGTNKYPIEISLNTANIKATI